ncbi:MAG: hypothetical protein RLZZ628_2320 [Bacteroidota bacterium]
MKFKIQIICTILLFLILGCYPPIIKSFEHSTAAMDAGYKLKVRGLRIDNSDTPCQLQYPYLYIDSSNGIAIHFGVTNRYNEAQFVKKDTHLLEDAFYLFQTSFDCETCSNLTLGNQKWGKHFSVDLVSIDELGYLKKGQKQGEWVTHTSCKDTVQGYYSKQPHLYKQDSALGKNGIFTTSHIYPYFLREFYKDGLRDGNYVFYDLYYRNVICETQFKKGTGYYKDFYLCEGMPIKCEGRYEAGKKVGLWIYYDINEIPKKLIHKK